MAFSPWSLLCGLDPYPLIRPFLFALDPEDAHTLTMKSLEWGLGPHLADADDPILHCRIWGLDFSNPIGLAAGLDKQATAMDALLRFGFGSLELGGVTPVPQPGNPRPRMFRVKEADGLINRFGFNSVGIDVFADRMARWRAKPGGIKNPVGVNLGKNKDSQDAAADYIACLEKLATTADFVTVNVSSPNTPGLRALQGREQLKEILSRVMAAKAQSAPGLPVLVKVALDMTDAEQDDVAAIVMETGVDGVIVGNTSTSRPAVIPAAVAKEPGGFSSPVMFDVSTKFLARFYQLTKGQVPLVGDCGIVTGEDAYRKIRAGASMVQIYTAMIFQGPYVVRNIKRDLAAALRRDGFDSVAAAVGADHR